MPAEDELVEILRQHREKRLPPPEPQPIPIWEDEGGAVEPEGTSE